MLTEARTPVTDFMSALMPLPAEVIARLGQMQDRIVLGSDFPNIPYAFAEQLDVLERLGLGEDWLRAVCWHNGVRLLGVDCEAAGSL
jgi:predicted TIM-barrel fold metal-dependent hydrolase